MSNNKQSSIEFYAQNEKDLYDRYLRGEMYYYKYCEKKHELLQQAKAMHKHEIRTAYCHGEFYQEEKLTEQYYNETFGGNNEQQ